MRMVCRSESFLQRVPVLISFVLADKAHSAHRFREQLKENDVQAVIPPIQRGNGALIEYDNY